MFSFAFHCKYELIYQQKNTLLICGKDGYVLEVSCPTAGDYDTSKTFLIPLTGLKRTEFKFKSIKDKLVVS